jgi:spore coat protein U-like protein
MKVVRFLIAIAAIACPASSAAIQCNLSIQGVAFGAYDVFSNQSADSTGNIAVMCDSATTYTIAISPGFGAYALRAMANGANRLAYNLFTDASRSSVWGDGTGGSNVVSGSASSANYTVFGRVPARQNVNVGSYTDNLVVTLTF